MKAKKKEKRAKYKTKVMVAENANYRIKDEPNRGGNTEVVQTAPVEPEDKELNEKENRRE